MYLEGEVERCNKKKKIVHEKDKIGIHVRINDDEISYSFLTPLNY